MEPIARVVTFLRSTAFQEASGKEAPPPRGPFVTISRQTGAGGNALALALVARMGKEGGELWEGWHAMDRELCEAVVQDPKLSVVLNSLVDERFSGPWADYLSQFFADSSPQLVVLKRIFRIMRAAAAMGKVVLVGRAANLVTRDLPLGIHLRLVASARARAGRIMQAKGLGREEAMAYLAECDESRRRLVKDYFHRDIDDPLLYDAVLNTEHIPVEEAAELALGLVRRKARGLAVGGGV